MVQAVAAYRSVVLSDDLKEIELERLRELAMFNERAALNYERQEGRQQGLQEGLQEQLRKDIISMYREGLGVEAIARISERSEDEVKKILGI